MGVIGTRDIFKSTKLCCCIYIPKNIYIVNNTLPPSLFLTSDLYLRANKSFLRDLSEIGHSEPTAEIIRELKKELNDNFKNKPSRSLSLKFEKEDFILPIAFPWIKQVLLNNMHTPNNL